MLPALGKKPGDTGGSSPFDTKGKGTHQKLPLCLDSHEREASSTSCFDTHLDVSPVYACEDIVSIPDRNGVVPEQHITSSLTGKGTLKHGP
jgi:hypothetical protein